MSFPRYPEDEGQVEGEQPSARRPATLTAAFWLGVASVVVGFVSLVLAFFMISDAELGRLTHQVNEQGRRLTLDQAWSVYKTLAIVVLVIFLVIAALWLMFLYFMRNGRNWARIVIAVVGAIWVIITAPSLTSASPVGVLLGVLQLVVVVGTIVFSFLRRSQDYFDAKRRTS